MRSIVFVVRGAMREIYKPMRLRGVCDTREPVYPGVPGTMTLDVVEEVEALDATSASAACFAVL